MYDIFLFILRFLICIVIACIQWCLIDLVILLFKKLKKGKGIKNEEK